MKGVWQMGFLKKLNPFDRDDDEKEKREAAKRATEEAAAEAAADAARSTESSSSSMSAGSGLDAIVAAAEATASAAGTTVVVEEAAVIVETSEGKVAGAGLSRTYTTKAGDKMEDVAAYFYGEAVHKQRLIDDNPFLQAYEGKELPGGMTINVGEDPNRGDAVSTA